MLTKEVAVKKRAKFNLAFSPGCDDKQVPDFYADIVENFKFENDNKYAFIIVAHFVHSLPYLLECVTSLGDVVALIPKQSSVVEKIKKFIEETYSDVIFSNINKNNLNDSPESADFLFRKIIENQAMKDRKLIILDHGGYFAPRFNDVLVKYKASIFGIVEHTWNGEVRYQKEFSSYNNASLPIPFLSIAHSNLKGLESESVAKSIVDALTVKTGGEGLNQSIDNLKHILIIGYGNIGKAVADVLRKRFGQRQNTLYIFDMLDKARDEARKYFLEEHITGDKNKFLSQADLIITSTSTKVLTREDFSSLKSGAVIACATSSDDQFDLNALENYQKVPSTDNSQPCIEYVHKEHPAQRIFLVSNGDSVNFSIGSTSHPIIHVILASICVNAQHLINHAVNDNLINNDDLIKKTYEKYFGIITQNEIEQISARLKTYYQGDCTNVKRLFGETVQIEDCYTNLSIVYQKNKDKVKQQKIPENDASYKNLPCYEDKVGLTFENPIDLEQIFDPKFYQKNDLEIPRRVLAIGSAGIGKTTLCKRIVHRWSQNKLWPQFKAIIWIKLRELDHAHFQTPNPTLADLFEVLILSRTSRDGEMRYTSDVAASWRNCLGEASEEALYLLDGYDELRLTQSPCQPIIDELLTQKVRGRYRHVFLTSRPFYAYQNDLDLIVDIKGFTSKNIHDYVKTFFKEASSTAQRLLDYLDNSSLIHGLAHIPIILELICSTVDSLPLNNSSPLTMTELYSMIYGKLWMAYLERDDIKSRINKTGNNSELLLHLRKRGYQRFRQLVSEEENFLMRLAWSSQIEDRVMLDSQCFSTVFDECAPSNLLLDIDIKKTNLITTDDKSDNEDKKQYFFIHNTFKYYLVALYIRQFLLDPSSNEKLAYKNRSWSIDEFILEHKLNPRYEQIWWFVAGLLKEDKKALNHFFELLLAKPHDLLGIKEIFLLIRCLDETSLTDNLEIKDKLIAYILKNIELCLSYSHKLLIGQLARHIGISTAFTKLESFQSLLLNALDNGELIQNNVFYILQHISYKKPDLLNKIALLTRKKSAQHLQWGRNNSLYIGITELAKTPNDDNAIASIIQVLSSTGEPRLRMDALEALGECNRADDIIINNVIASFFDGEHDSVPEYAVATFKRIAPLNPKFPKKLLDIIDGDLRDIESYLATRPDRLDIPFYWSGYGTSSWMTIVNTVRVHAIAALRYLQKPDADVTKYLFTLLELSIASKKSAHRLHWKYNEELARTLVYFSLKSKKFADDFFNFISDKNIDWIYIYMAKELSEQSEKNNYVHSKFVEFIIDEHFELIDEVVKSMVPIYFGISQSFTFIRHIFKKSSFDSQEAVDFIRQVICWDPMFDSVIKKICDFMATTNKIEDLISAIFYLTQIKLNKPDLIKSINNTVYKIIVKSNCNDTVKEKIILLLIKNVAIPQLLELVDQLEFDHFYQYFELYDDFVALNELCEKDSNFSKKIILRFFNNLERWGAGFSKLSTLHNGFSFEVILHKLNNCKFENAYCNEKIDTIDLLDKFKDEKATLILISEIKNIKPHFFENNAPGIISKRNLTKEQIYLILDYTDREDVLEEALQSTQLFILLSIYIECKSRIFLKIFCTRFMNSVDYIFIEDKYIKFYENYTLYQCEFNPLNKNSIINDFHTFKIITPDEFDNIHKSKNISKKEGDEKSISFQPSKNVEGVIQTTANLVEMPRSDNQLKKLQSLTNPLLVNPAGVINLGNFEPYSENLDYLLRISRYFPRAHFKGRIDDYVGSAKTLSKLSSLLALPNARNLIYDDFNLGLSLYLTPEYEQYKTIMVKRRDEEFVIALFQLKPTTELALAEHPISDNIVHILISYIRGHPMITAIQVKSNLDTLSENSVAEINQCVNDNRQLYVKKFFREIKPKYNSGTLDLSSIILGDEGVKDLIEFLKTDAGKNIKYITFNDNAITDIGAEKLIISLVDLENICRIRWDDLQHIYDPFDVHNKINDELKFKINKILQVNRSKKLLHYLRDAFGYGNYNLGEENITNENLQDALTYVKENKNIINIVWPSEFHISQELKSSIDDILSENRKVFVIEFLSKLVNPKNIETISISSNEIGDAGALELIEFIINHSATLQIINLSYTGISDLGMRHLLPAFRKCPLLREIKISGNHISNDIHAEIIELCFNNDTRITKEKIIKTLKSNEDSLDLTNEYVDKENCNWLLDAIGNNRFVKSIKWGEFSLIKYQMRLQVEKTLQRNSLIQSSNISSGSATIAKITTQFNPKKTDARPDDVPHPLKKFQ